MPYNCDLCGKALSSRKSLERHKAAVHGTVNEDTVDTDANDLDIDVPPAPKYECGDCGAEIKKGQAECPGCGTGLDWSGL